MDAPQEVVGRFFLGGDFETVDACALRIHIAQHVIDGAVLARCVERLEADQQGPLTLGIQQVLQFSQLLRVVLQVRSCRGLVLVLRGGGGVDFAQLRLAPWLDLKQFSIAHESAPSGYCRRTAGFVCVILLVPKSFFETVGLLVQPAMGMKHRV